MNGCDGAGGCVRYPRVGRRDRHPGVEELPPSDIHNTRVQIGQIFFLGEEGRIYLLIGKGWSFIKKVTSLLFLARAGHNEIRDGCQLHAEC